jgi:hypothetical protein
LVFFITPTVGCDKVPWTIPPDDDAVGGAGTVPEDPFGAVVNVWSGDVANTPAAFAELTLKWYEVEGERFPKVALCEVTRCPSRRLLL